MQRLISGICFRYFVSATLIVDILVTALGDTCKPESEQACFLPASLLQRSHQRVVSQPAPPAALSSPTPPEASSAQVVESLMAQGELDKVQKIFADAAVMHQAASEELSKATQVVSKAKQAEDMHPHALPRRGSALLQQSASAASDIAESAKAATATASQTEWAERAVKEAAEATKRATEATEAAVAAASVIHSPGVRTDVLNEAGAVMKAAEEAQKLASEKALKAKNAAEGLELEKAKQDLSLATVAVDSASDSTFMAGEKARASIVGGASESIAGLSEAGAAMEAAAAEHETASQKTLMAKHAEDELVKLKLKREKIFLDAGLTADQQRQVEAELMIKEATKMRDEAERAKHDAAEAQLAAQKAEAEILKAKDAEEICYWKMPTWCMASFVYRGASRTGCIDGENSRPWCSHDVTFSGGWSECSFTCEQRSRMENIAKSIVLGQIRSETADIGVRAESRTGTTGVGVRAESRAGADNSGVRGESHAGADDSGIRAESRAGSDGIGVRAESRAGTAGSGVRAKSRAGSDDSGSGEAKAETDGSGVRAASRVETNSSQVPQAGPIAVPPGGLDPNYLVPVYIPAINLQSGNSVQQQLGGFGATMSTASAYGPGATATLEESGYLSVAALCDSAEMAMFVRRVVAQIGCLITNEKNLEGFAPWYSGEADVQSFTKLDSELRCLCTRGQGPPWLTPIDPNNPPTGGMLTCTGRRCKDT